MAIYSILVALMQSLTILGFSFICKTLAMKGIITLAIGNILLILGIYIGFIFWALIAFFIIDFLFIKKNKKE